MNKSFKLVSIGRVVKAHGIKGELKFFLYNNDSTLLLSNLKIWFKIKNKFDSFNLVFSKGINGEIVKLDKINDRNEAELLKGKEFFVSRDDFPEPGKENFYLNDIINFVVWYNGKEIGLISEVLPLPSGNMIELNIDGKDVLIPMIDEYVKFFDFDKKMVILKNIKELMNL